MIAKFPDQSRLLPAIINRYAERLVAKIAAEVLDTLVCCILQLCLIHFLLRGQYSIRLFIATAHAPKTLALKPNFQFIDAVHKNDVLPDPKPPVSCLMT